MPAFKITFLLIAVVLSSGCQGYFPQRRVLISDHPSGQPVGVTLASFPAELRAYTILKLVEPDERTALQDLAAKIAAEQRSSERSRLVCDYNRRLALAVRHVLVPEPPATVVVTQTKLNPTIKVSTGTNAGGELTLTAEQAATNLGKMTPEELKAYFAYLSYIAARNLDGQPDTNFNRFLLDLAVAGSPSSTTTNKVQGQ
jgi:hypothetical protein